MREWSDKKFTQCHANEVPLKAFNDFHMIDELRTPHLRSSFQNLLAVH